MFCTSPTRSAVVIHSTEAECGTKHEAAAAAAAVAATIPPILFGLIVPGVPAVVGAVVALVVPIYYKNSLSTAKNKFLGFWVLLTP